jgi:hypothetical protein
MTPNAAGGKRRMLASVLVFVLILVIAPVFAVGWFWWQAGAPSLFSGDDIPQLPPPNTAETLVIAANATTPLETANTYTGVLTLVIEGSVPLADTGLVDAFYLHTDSIGGTLERPIVVTPPPLLVDSLPLPIPSPRPSYAPFHVYRVPYPVGNTPRRLSFTLDAPQLDRESDATMHVFIIPGSP